MIIETPIERFLDCLVTCVTPNEENILNYCEDRDIMDKFVIVGGFLCFTADVFAIASLATPEWVVMEFAGKRNTK